MTNLNLTLKKKWFDMIASGEKKEEYREIKKYWIKRLININHPEEEKCENKVIPENIIFDLANHPPESVMQAYYCNFKRLDTITATNGYGKHRPLIVWKHKGIRIGKPNPAWCEPRDIGKDVFILSIVEIIKK